MKNYKLLAILVSGSLAASAANAETNKSINEELSKTRSNISSQILQNKLYDAELEGLRKQQEIKQIKDALDGTSNVSTSPAVSIEKDTSLRFDEELHNEDILSSDNDWEQNVGFIYQDSLNIGGESTNSPISGLTSQSSGLDDNLLSDMLVDAIEEAEAEETEVSTNNSSPVESNVFKLTAIEINKLVVKGDYKSAELKVGYITDNGFQKIRGAKITKAKIGKVFDVKGQESFKVKDITNQGVTIINLKNNKEVFISK